MSILTTYPPQARPYSQQAPPVSTASPLNILSATLSAVLPTTLSNFSIPPWSGATRVDMELSPQKQTATAIVYCEANFGAVDGKTANGLIRHSEKYQILSVIDSEQAGKDSGIVIDDKPNAIHICNDLADALARMARREDRSFKDVVNETLRRGLLTGERPTEPARPAFAVHPEACGFLPGVDPLRLNQLVDEMEVDRFVGEHVQDHTKP